MKKETREIVCSQLRQYTNMKRILAEHASYELRARKLVRLSGSPNADATATQALLHLEPDDNIRALQSWVWAIEEAWQMFRSERPPVARLMEKLYGLKGNPVDYHTPEKRETLAHMLHVSEATIYRWREMILYAVFAGAIEAGVIHASGSAPGQKKEERMEV